MRENKQGASNFQPGLASCFFRFVWPCGKGADVCAFWHIKILFLSEGVSHTVVELNSFTFGFILFQ